MCPDQSRKHADNVSSLRNHSHALNAHADQANHSTVTGTKLQKAAERPVNEVRMQTRGAQPANEQVMQANSRIQNTLELHRVTSSPSGVLHANTRNNSVFTGINI